MTITISNNIINLVFQSNFIEVTLIKIDYKITKNTYLTINYYVDILNGISNAYFNNSIVSLKLFEIFELADVVL